jgi:DNA-directed RNA polymerase specialized sigma24 family protein
VDAQGSRPDADLIGESLSRPEAFAAIFERHFAAVHRYLARRAGAGLADDLASEVFTVAFARRASFRGHSDSALPWLLGIATNLLHNHGRAGVRRGTSPHACARVGPRSSLTSLSERLCGTSAGGAPGTWPRGLRR